MRGKGRLIASPLFILLHREDIHEEHRILLVGCHINCCLGQPYVCDLYVEAQLILHNFRSSELTLCDSSCEITLIIKPVRIKIIGHPWHQALLFIFKRAHMQKILKPVVKRLALFRRKTLKPFQVIVLILILIFERIELRLLHQHHHIWHLLILRQHGKMTRRRADIGHFKFEVILFFRLILIVRLYWQRLLTAPKNKYAHKKAYDDKYSFHHRLYLLRCTNIDNNNSTTPKNLSKLRRHAVKSSKIEQFEPTTPIKHPFLRRRSRFLTTPTKTGDPKGRLYKHYVIVNYSVYL